MATSSSDESCTAQKVYNLSSSLDSGSRLSPNKRKCPLCKNFNKTFYCKDCINGGLFYHSKSKATERYTDKRTLLYELKDYTRSTEEKCLDLLETKFKANILKTRLRMIKEKIMHIKLLIERKTEKQERQLVIKNSLKQKMESLCKNLPKYDQKVGQFRNHVALKKEKNDIGKASQSENRYLIKRMIKSRVEQLLKYIFIIEKVDLKNKMDINDSDSMISALADASRTTYSTDKWEFDDFADELHYQISGPTLPISGNYSLYNLWAERLKKEPNENNERNPAVTISAALTYTAQLVIVLAHILNIRLPHKMNYIDYQTVTMEEKQFAQKVAYLNANILYLCITQNVRLQNLHAYKTINNLLELMDVNNKDLGRDGPLELDSEMVDVLEESLSNDLNILNDNSDSEESFPRGWEAVPHVQCPEASPGAASAQSMQTVAPQQASSVAGGLVNSAAASLASIWRGFTGR